MKISFLILLSLTKKIVSVFECSFLPSWDAISQQTFPKCFPYHLREECSPLGTPLLTTGGLQKYYSADFSRWHKVIRKYDNNYLTNQTMKVVFLGGSMTSGVMFGDCYLDDKRKINHCSTNFTYPVRFKMWLQNSYPKVNITMYNLAIGGSNTKGLLNIIGNKLKTIEEVDVVFIHYLTNDNYEAIFDPIGLSIAFEDLIRFLLNSWFKKAAIIYIAMLPSNQDTCINKTILSAHDIVLTHYKIPVLNIEQNRLKIEDVKKELYDSFLLKGCERDEVDASFYVESAHPPWWQHQLVADYLSYSWKFQHDYICSILNIKIQTTKMQDSIEILTTVDSSYQDILYKNNKSLPLLISKFENRRKNSDRFCVSPLSYYRPNDFYELKQEEIIVSGINSTLGGSINSGHKNYTKNNISSNVNWIYGEDLKGNKKPGWWIDNINGGIISFSMKMWNNNPIVVLSYLRSYNQMGKAIVYFDDNKDFIVNIDALNKKENDMKVSLMESKQICIKNGTLYKLYKQQLSNKNNRFIIPFCNETNNYRERIKWDSNGLDGGRQNLLQQNGFETHKVTIEVLPAISLQDKHNKFKILSITSC